MAIGEDPNFDYLTLPFDPNWKPAPERAWAERFLNADHTEDYAGFTMEFRRRHPLLQHNHGDTYLPPSVNYYLRHDQFGNRLDIDWELVLTPMTEEEQAELTAAKREQIRQRRRAALKKRGLLKDDSDTEKRGAKTAKTQAELVARHMG